MNLEPGIYHACPVCDAKAVVQVEGIDGSKDTMDCPACAGTGLVPHACPA